MKIKYFSLKLMRLLCASIFFLTFLASFGRTEFLLSLLLGVCTLSHLFDLFSCFAVNKVFTTKVVLKSTSLDAFSLLLPVSLLVSVKLGISWGILVFILLVVFCIVYAVHTFRVYILCKGGEIYEG